MTEQELAWYDEAIAASDRQGGERMHPSLVIELLAEVRRLKELVRLAYLEGVWSQTHPEFVNADQLWLQSDAKASLGGGA
jgi:hypothetical protein